MDRADASDRLIVVLLHERDSIVAELVRRIQRQVPAYSLLPQAELLQRLGVPIDQIISSLGEHDPAVLTHYLEERTHWRLSMSIPIEAQLQIATLASTVICEHLSRVLAGEPADLAHAVRRVETLASTSRHVMSRVHLAQIVHPPEA